MRRAIHGGWLLCALAALAALAACGRRDALTLAVVTKPGPDAGGFQSYTPVDAAAETQVVAPPPEPDAAPDLAIAPPPAPDAARETAPVAEAGSVAEVRDAASSTCPQREVPQGKFTFVSAGNGSSCAIRDDGAVKCWGSPFYPVSAIPAGSFSRVDVYIGVCGVRSSGEIACWGGESAPASGGPFLDVGAGEGMSCALRVDGTMQCSGPAPPQNMPPYKYDSMSEGAYFTCGLETGAHAAVCWGMPGPQGNIVTPGPFRQVGTGRVYACGLLMDGTAKCWPLGITGDSPGPAPAGVFREISAGEFSVCGSRDDDSVECWGKNVRGEARPPAGARFRHVSVGSTHACGILLDGTLTCWGETLDPCGPG